MSAESPQKRSGTMKSRPVNPKTQPGSASIGSGLEGGSPSAKTSDHFPKTTPGNTPKSRRPEPPQLDKRGYRPGDSGGTPSTTNTSAGRSRRISDGG